jgi:hypothetical protein
MVTCPLAPSVPHLLSSSCSSRRAFGLGFLQTPPRGDALALCLAFGAANTWRKDLHLTSSVPCPAHTPALSAAAQPRPLERLVGLHLDRVVQHGDDSTAQVRPKFQLQTGIPSRGCL